MKQESWDVVLYGTWKFLGEHITIKEGRTVILALRRLSRAHRNSGKRHLLLVDNMGLCFALSKGRACSCDLLR
eukprot:6682196-Pyramimonas_sp.AAC.1